MFAYCLCLFPPSVCPSIWEGCRVPDTLPKYLAGHDLDPACSNLCPAAQRVTLYYIKHRDMSHTTQITCIISYLMKHFFTDGVTWYSISKRLCSAASGRGTRPFLWRVWSQTYERWEEKRLELSQPFASIPHRQPDKVSAALWEDRKLRIICLIAAKVRPQIKRRAYEP